MSPARTALAFSIAVALSASACRTRAIDDGDAGDTRDVASETGPKLPARDDAAAAGCPIVSWVDADVAPSVYDRGGIPSCRALGITQGLWRYACEEFVVVMLHGTDCVTYWLFDATGTVLQETAGACNEPSVACIAKLPGVRFPIECFNAPYEDNGVDPCADAGPDAAGD